MRSFAARVAAVALVLVMGSAGPASAQPDSAAGAAKALYAWVAQTDCGNWESHWSDTQDFLDLELFKSMATVLRNRNKIDGETFGVDPWTGINWCASAYRVGTPKELDDGNVAVPVSAGITGMPGSAAGMRWTPVTVTVRHDDDGYRVYDVSYGAEGGGSLRATLADLVQKIGE